MRHAKRYDTRLRYSCSRARSTRVPPAKLAKVSSYRPRDGDHPFWRVFHEVPKLAKVLRYFILSYLKVEPQLIYPPLHNLASLAYPSTTAANIAWSSPCSLTSINLPFLATFPILNVVLPAPHAIDAQHCWGPLEQFTNSHYFGAHLVRLISRRPMCWNFHAR